MENWKIDKLKNFFNETNANAMKKIDKIAPNDISEKEELKYFPRISSVAKLTGGSFEIFEILRNLYSYAPWRDKFKLVDSFIHKLTFKCRYSVDYGIEIHSLFEAIIHHNFSPKKYQKEQAFINDWKKKFNPIPVFFEKRVIGKSFEISGTIDAGVIIDNDFWLIDIKTTKDPNKNNIINQLALYWYVLKDNGMMDLLNELGIKIKLGIVNFKTNVDNVEDDNPEIFTEEFNFIEIKYNQEQLEIIAKESIKLNDIFKKKKLFLESRYKQKAKKDK